MGEIYVVVELGPTHTRNHFFLEHDSDHSIFGSRRVLGGAFPMAHVLLTKQIPKNPTWPFFADLSCPFGVVVFVYQPSFQAAAPDGTVLVRRNYHVRLCKSGVFETFGSSAPCCFVDDRIAGDSNPFQLILVCLSGLQTWCPS